MPDPATLKLIEDLNEDLKNATSREVIRFFLEHYKGRIAFASSLGAEDQVITEMIADIDKQARIFMLDTGRLFQETYDLLDITTKRYKINIKVYYPDTSSVEEMVSVKGINLFFNSVEDRKLCCSIRKVMPLIRALENVDFWISGLRKNQSVTRKDAAVVEWDEVNNKIKVNPLVNWTESNVWDYIKTKNIPYNRLHDKAYPSIGCQPCTRAVKPGDDVRSGRWWWEEPTLKECGLHKR